MATKIHSNGTDHSLSNELSKAKEYFLIRNHRQYKNTVIDRGQILSFPPFVVNSEIPPGIYYCTETREENFTLSKSSASAGFQEPDDELYIELLEAFGEDL